MQKQIDRRNDFETFFAEAPALNPNVSKITGVICGYRVEEIEDKLIQKMRYLDKLIDELAKGKAMVKILRIDDTQSESLQSPAGLHTQNKSYTLHDNGKKRKGEQIN